MESGQTSTEGVEQRLIDDGRVAVLTINRPAARNALSSSGDPRSLDETLQKLDADETARAVVLTGAAPGFCAGSDLKELGGMSVAEMASHEADTGRFVRSLQRLDLPVVAAVEGFALGGGFLLATGCDLVVTAEPTPAGTCPRSPSAGYRHGACRRWCPGWDRRPLVASPGAISRSPVPTCTASVWWTRSPRAGAALELASELAVRLATLPPNAVASTKQALADAVVGPAASLDARTTELFAQDCETDAARASLDRFARKTS